MPLTKQLSSHDNGRLQTFESEEVGQKLVGADGAIPCEVEADPHHGTLDVLEFGDGRREKIAVHSLQDLHQRSGLNRLQPAALA